MITYENLLDFKVAIGTEGKRNFSNDHFNFNVTIINREYEDDLSFKNCMFNHGLKIENVIFNGNVCFDGASFGNEIITGTKNVIKATFNGDKVSFNKCKFYRPTFFNESEFSTLINFDETIFNEKVLFHKCKFNDKTSFHNTKFLKLTDFYHASFKKLQIFYKTDFNGNAVFSRVTFTENICFHYVSGKSNLIFRHANIKKGLDLSLAIIDGQINFFNVKLEDFLSIKDPKDDEDGAKEYDDYVKNGDITHKNKRETFRIIKDELIGQNNVIDSLIYKSLEMASLDEELNDNEDSKFSDKLILILAKKSNGFGLSWGKALKFTLLTGIVFYSVSLLGIKNYPFSFGMGNTLDAIGFFLGNYFEFLNPTHKLDYIGKEYEIGMWFKFFNFGGRILVGYGIFQFIVSFRKFSKK